tara:strand:+ start:495 stop:1463 length:969 start_codon:yes stop_codon:yes gene_type:complete
MAVYTKVNQAEINIIESKFNIGKILSFSGIKKGIENTNYLIKTKRRKYILTIFEKRVEKKDLPFFMNLMYGLSKLKIKCPEPLKSKNGKYLIKLKNKNACIVSFLVGKDKKNLSPKDCYIVGKNIAKLHNASKKLKLQRENSLSVPKLNKLLFSINKKINKIQNNILIDMRNEYKFLSKSWPKNLDSGIIHCDLFIDNIFFYKRKYYGFIDFYFSANDFLAYELSICINALCFNKNGKKYFLNRNKSTNLLKGYESIRKLNINEKKYFNILCRGSALRYLLTRAYDYLNTPKDAYIKIKDPREYIQKLKYHQNISTFKDYLK